MNIYPCGTKCFFNGIPGYISRIDIVFDSVSYEITYFYNSEKKLVWFKEAELSFDISANKKEIGFKNGDK
jgi:hypothetical protein